MRSGTGCERLGPQGCQRFIDPRSILRSPGLERVPVRDNRVAPVISESFIDLSPARIVKAFFPAEVNTKFRAFDNASHRIRCRAGKLGLPFLLCLLIH